MKRLIKTILTLQASLVVISGAYAQSHKETINKEYTFTGSGDKVLVIDNISGDLVVEAYQGTKVLVEVNMELRARTDRQLERAKSEVKLGTEERGDSLVYFVDGPCNCDCRDRNRRYNWNRCDYDYKFILDFKVKVPASTNLELYTVNNGDIRVDGVTGEIMAKNVNGGIYLDKIAGATKAHTINGDVEITYTSNPKEHSMYYTLNGDLTVFYLPNLSADMSFKSFNGDFYTNFDITQQLPSRITSDSRRSRGTTYKIDERTAVRVGQGGVELDFETFNGDIFIKKK